MHFKEQNKRLLIQYFIWKKIFVSNSFKKMIQRWKNKPEINQFL